MGTRRINDPSQQNHFLTHVAAKAIQDGHRDPTKLAVVPAPNEGPDVLTPLLKLNASVAKSLRGSEYRAQDTGVHVPWKG